MENRKLIDYLPEYMQEYAEMRQIMLGGQPDVDAFHEGVNRVWNNQFLADADEYGVGRWESILAITPKATDTLDERKFRILAWWTQELPYTLPKLNEMLEALCGAGNYDIVMDNRHYRITIKLGLSNQENYSDVESLLERVLPANLIRTILIMFNTHDTLAAFTHSHLATMTHEQLRTEV